MDFWNLELTRRIGVGQGAQRLALVANISMAMIHFSLTGLITPSANTAPANSIAVLRLIPSWILFIFASGLEDRFQCDLPLPMQLLCLPRLFYDEC